VFPSHDRREWDVDAGAFVAEPAAEESSEGESEE